MFETRRSEFRAWEEWARTPPVTRDVPGVGPVTAELAVLEVALPLVSFRHTYRFPDGTALASDSVLRFRDRAELEADLVGAGFRVLDVRQAPDRPGREFVVLAERAG